MFRYLRKVDLKPWLEAEATPEWLGEEAIPADPVCSFRTRKNTMSVFTLDDDARNVGRIAAALTVSCGQVREFEYIILDSTDVDSAAIVTRQTEGDTADAEVNGLHRDLEQISAQKLVTLTTLVLNKNLHEVCDRILAKDVAVQILKGVSDGSLTNVSPKIIQKAEQLVGRAAQRS